MNLASLTRAAEIIRAGGVVAYPTESCFGFGCNPRNIAALRRILRIKRRAPGKGLIVIADRYARLRPLLECAADGPRARIAESWPGPHTWLLPAGACASHWLRGAHRKLAVRVTAHRDAARLCRLARMALVSTSANRAGRRALRSADAVRREFGGEVDFIVDGRIGRARAPSVIRDGAGGRVLRA
ncbi:MAG: L-threonylcarbamoyladenylate synthase [Gammaproteobacteria bacterium]